MTEAMLLRMEGIHYNFGVKPLLEGASLTLYKGDKVAITGRNGCGKSTLLQIAAGLIPPLEGEIFTEPKTKLAYLEQDPKLDDFDSLGAYMESALHFDDDLYQAQAYLDYFGLHFELSPKKLSGGERRQAALARIFALKADILLLDEPTNHLDIYAIEWLEKKLNNFSGALAIISHDRRFLEHSSRAVLWLDRGQVRRLEQNFSAFEEWRDRCLEEEQQAQHKLARKIAREELWLRYGVTARRKRNVRRLAELKALQRQRQAYQAVEGKVSVKLSQESLQSKLVIDAAHIYKAYHQKVLVKDFSIKIHQKDRVGFIGKNGVGKTTLLKLLTGQLKPDQGTLKLAHKLNIAYLDQQRTLDEKQRVKDYLTDNRGETVIVHNQERHVYSYMRDFLFREEQARLPIAELSGGERARLILAKLFTKQSDLLLLDEPTNDLDMETLDVLEDMLNNYKGTVLFVSHDRDFLDRLADYSLTPSDSDNSSGLWYRYAGGYTAMRAQQEKTPSLNVKVKNSVKAKMPKQNVGEKEQKRRLSYHQKYALDILPKEIDHLTREIEQLENSLNHIDCYISQKDHFQKVSKALLEKQQQKAKKEEEWLTLALLQEQLTQS